MKPLSLFFLSSTILLSGCVSEEFKEVPVNETGSAAIIENTPDVLIIQALTNMDSLQQLLDEIKTDTESIYSSSGKTIPFTFYPQYQKAIDSGSIYTSAKEDVDLADKYMTENGEESRIFYKSLLPADQLPVKIYTYYVLTETS